MEKVLGATIFFTLFNFFFCLVSNGICNIFVVWRQ